MQTGSSVGKRALTGTLYTLFGDYFVYILNFVKGLILARLIPPELYGAFGMADFFKGLFSQINQLAFDQAVIVRQDKLDEAYTAHFIFNVVTAFLSVLITVIFLPMVRSQYGDTVAFMLIILMGTIVIQALGSTANTYLRKNFRFGRLSGIQMVSAVLSFIVSVYLAYRGFDVWALLASQGVLVVVSHILPWVISGVWFSCRIDVGVLKSMLQFSFVVWIAAVFGFVMLQFDDFLVGKFAGLTMLGFYTKAYSIAKQPLGLFSQVANKVAGPVIAEVRNDPAKLTHGFNLIVGLVFKGTLLMGMLIFIWAPELISLLIGDVWLPSVPLLRGLILYLVTQPVWDLMSTFFTFTEQTKLYIRGQVTQAVLLLTLGTAVVAGYGAPGAAYAVSAIVAVTTFYFMWTGIQGKIQVQWLNTFVLPILVTIVTGFMSWWLVDILNLRGLFFWATVGIMPVLLYLGGLYIVQSSIITRDIRFLMNVLKRKER